MLESFRAISRTWFGKILGAFLIVGLAGFGISNVLLDFGSNNVASVGGEDISVRAFQREYQNRVNQYGQQFGRIPTNQEAVALGVPSVVLTQLGAEAALNKLGKDMGIGVSDARLSKMLRDDPSFADILGKFDAQNFSRVLQASGYTQEEYFELQRGAARRQQVAQGLFIGSPVPDAAIELVNRYGTDKRTIDYFTLGAGNLMLDIPSPTEDDLAAYLKEHQADYRTKETRTIDVLALTIESLAATKQITDEEIAAEYERTKDQRVKIERRTIRQVPLTAEQQTLFETGKAAGKSFDQLVAEAGLAPTDVGTLAQAEITDTDLATAAFGLAQGDFVIIPGVGGQRAVTVTAIEPGGQISLDEAREQIRASLAQKAARDEYTDILDQIEELRAAFQPLPQIAERFGLPVTQVTVTAGVPELSAVPAITADQYQRISDAVFAATKDKLAPTVAISANNNVWFDLKEVEEARDQTLDEVRDAVTQAWTDEKTAAAVQAEVDKALADLRSGKAFADVAAGLNQFPQLSQPLARAGESTPPLDQTVAAAAFAGGEGHVGSAVNSDGDHVVFQVVEIIPAGEDPTEDVGGYIASTRQNTLYSDFMSGLRDAMGLRINEKALTQLLALDQTGQ
ncbi:MAG TPA: SurA N-terminal domain-containing protein [Devosia sp.]